MYTSHYTKNCTPIISPVSLHIFRGFPQCLALHGRPMAMPLWRQTPSADPALGSCTEVNVLRIGALAEVRKNGEGPWGGHGILGY